MRLRARHVAAIFLTAPAAPALAQAPECGRFPTDGHTHQCTCAPGPHQGSVWGSGPYTGDSDICAAATHAGVIGPEGGPVIALSTVPPASYVGTAANGVMSSSWGEYDTAFVFYRALRAAGAAAAPPFCGRLGEEADTTCLCPPGSHSGAVWGSGPYTGDSDICTAAVHAGVIGTEGGPVLVQRMQGQQSYAGSTANGVTTSGWGSYNVSFDVLRASE